MSDQPTLRDIDIDGAIQETAAETMDVLESIGDTRASFLRRAGLAGGAFLGSGALFSALAAPGALANASVGQITDTKFDRPPSRIFGTGDDAILNYALVLEYLESQFYLDATANQHKFAFIPNTEPRSRIFLKAVVGDEVAHRNLLKKVLGRKAIKKPQFDFHGADKHYHEFLSAAFAFENVGVHAYHGQAFNLKSAAYVAAALSIVTVEGRHAAAVGLIRNESDYGITPSGAFDTGQGASKVLSEVESLHFITKLYPAPDHT